jgi:SAM-dependent MidA family methyltransferase
LQAAKQLILPGGMGERFQAIGFARGIARPMRGFALRDMRDSL